MIQDPRLDALVGRAYKVFECPPPAHLGVCTTCCMRPADERALRTPSVRDTPARLVGSWGNAAYISEIFPKNIGKYLAPRLLDALRKEEVTGLETELILARGYYGDRTLYRDEEAEILDEFRFLYLEAFRGDNPRQEYLMEVLCMFTLSMFPVEPSLKQIESWPLEDFINRIWTEWCAIPGRPEIQTSCFWNIHADQHHAFVTEQKELLHAWCVGPRVRQRLEQVFDSYPESTRLWQRAAELERSVTRGIVD